MFDENRFIFAKKKTVYGGGISGESGEERQREWEISTENRESNYGPGLTDGCGKAFILSFLSREANRLSLSENAEEKQQAGGNSKDETGISPSW